jgi:2-hydroxy-3-oxopropionate reductase
MIRVKKYKVGFVSLGIMGKPMVHNLLENKVQVYFYARKQKIIKSIEKHGGIFVSSVSELPKYANILITNLPKTKDVELVTTGKAGMLDNLKKGSCVIDMSTISPEGATQINSKLNKKGAFFIDAPVSGGEAGAILGNLSIMVGGDKKAFHKVKPILKMLGEKITYIGNSGSGQICKMCNQVLVAQTIQAVSEIINISRKSKVDASKVREALLGGYANSKILEIHGKRMIDSDFKPGFKLSLHYKDLKIAKSFLNSLGIQLKSLNQVKKLMNLAECEGLSDLDSSAIHSILEKTYK